MRARASSASDASTSESSPTNCSAMRLPRSWRQNCPFSCTSTFTPGISGRSVRSFARTAAMFSSLALPSFK